MLLALLRLYSCPRASVIYDVVGRVDGMWAIRPARADDANAVASTRLTCFKSTVRVRSRTASSKDATQRFLAVRKTPSLECYRPN